MKAHPINIVDYFKEQSRDYKIGYISAVRNFIKSFEFKTKEEMLELCQAAEKFLSKDLE